MWTCPKCGAMNYPSIGMNNGCECCGYTGYTITTSDGSSIANGSVQLWKLNEKE